MENYQGIFALNSSAQNEFLAWQCLEHFNIEKFKKMLSGGMPLSAFMLCYLRCLDYDLDTIKDVLRTTTTIKDDVMPWMKNCLVVDEIGDILHKFEEFLPKGYPSDEECEHLKLWNTLKKRCRYDILVQYVPEMVEKIDSIYARRALLNLDFDKYVDMCFQKDWYSIYAHPRGRKYIIDHGKGEQLIESLFPLSDAVGAYCIANGLEEKLYECGYYRILLGNQKTDLFVKNHSRAPAFLNRYPEKVNWECLWHHDSDKKSRKELLDYAIEHQDVPVCFSFLCKHLGFWERRKLKKHGKL